ncbi:PDR/VanB family oxidoreductase [Streptomyces sp. NPDC048637]|uniref:PDR/VanB family oxidoreductase n=1 Tax=Streptomyces sp. NPDC048637 TaxID=3155636 RepID=UPI00342E8790
MTTLVDWTALDVAAVRDEVAEVRSFELVHPAGAALPKWAPGAHIDVLVTDADPGMVRQYSLCGDPDDSGRYRFAVLREENGRGASRFLHESVTAGSQLLVRAPRNNFPLVSAPHYLFIAGGIGITPVLPMVRTAHEQGAEWDLFYGGRRRERMAFLPDLDGYGARVRVLPEDEHGLLPLAGILAAAGPDTAVYCCGPEPLLAAVERLWDERRVGTLHIERFQPRPQEPSAAPDKGFDVRVASTGATVRVGPEQSIMDALGTVGIDVPSSCREGTCASCETTVLAGEVEHRDSVLSEEERATGETMMLCVSRARSPQLVLDL